MKYLIQPFNKMFDFSGKSSLKEFWIFFLFISVLVIVAGFLSSAINFRYLRVITLVVILIPFYAIGFRRLNDAGILKWFFLIPFVNLVLAVMPSKEAK